jgi:transcriptional regulator GlxA family with amidase domain
MLPVHRVAALALADVVAFDLSIGAQVFGHGDERDRYRFVVCARAPGPVRSTSGFEIVASHGLEALADCDTVIVPGYAPYDSPAPDVIDTLRAAAERGARIVSVCTGAFALAAAGLLDGRRATTHWQDAGALAARFPQVSVDPDVLYVEDGQIATSAGVAAGIDLCLRLVRNDHGAAAAARIARRMVVAPHRDGGQAQHVQRQLPSGGEGLAATLDWASARLDHPLSVSDLAGHSGWAPRTFARHFRAQTGTTPTRWLIAQRLLEARRLLEDTDLSIDDVAAHCGLGTATNLRLHFARDAQTTPTAYRRSYRGRDS